MATFKAIPEISHNLLIYANELFIVSNNSTVGSLPSDFEIDGNVEKSEINPEDYIVTSISKIQWDTSDGKSFSDDSLSYKFSDSGIFQVYLTIWSEPFLTIDGRVFYFKTRGYIDVTVQSKFLKLFYDFNPTWSYTQNVATDDFYKSAAKLFERIYKDTKSLYSLWDANEINPLYFEYLALTLGHDSLYSSKVGYKNEEESGNFEEYDIYDRISRNKATDKEINYFRRFLIHSSELFRKKGTNQDISSFLSFFSIDGKAIELWTKNWGQTPVGLIDELFLDYDVENNKHGFKWNDIRVVGNSNDNGMIKKTLNSIIIDNYHQIEKVEFDVDQVATVTMSGSTEGWYEFEIEKKPVYVTDVRNNNGNLLIEEESYQQEPFVYTLDENIPVRQDPSNLGILQVSPDVIDYGDKITLSYALSEENTISSVIANTNRSVKNFDANVVWSFKKINDPNTIESFRYSENEIFFIFRGIKNSSDFYANIGEYYRFSINTRNSWVSLSRVVKNPSDETAIIQKINLGTADSPLYNKPVVNNCEAYVFNDDSYYEFKLQVSGSLVSAYVRLNDMETRISNNVNNETGGSVYGQQACGEWITLFEGVSLQKDSVKIQTVDEEGNQAVTIQYTEIETGGNYGVGCKNGIMELKDVAVNILDPDETLWTTAEKELDIKPKYLEWIKATNLRFNNDINNHETFTKQISQSYDPEVETYTIEEGGSASLNFLYMNNIKVTEDIATRYIVNFDSEWLSRFKDSAEVSRKIIIPFGNQRNWFLADIRATDKSIFKNYYGSSDVETTPTTGSDVIRIPGLFAYNESVPLDNYETEPDDAFSSLTRENDTSLTFTLSDRMQQYMLSNFEIPLRGVFQEVCPDSGIFTSITGARTIKYNTKWENPVFSPIVYNGSSKRVTGVRFKNCDDIQRLIDVNSLDGQIPVLLWGHYSLEMDKAYFKFRPDDTTLTEGSNNSYIVKIFLPIGVLDSTRRTYGLSTTFLHDAINQGMCKISILGIYVRNPSVIFNSEAKTVKLPDNCLNPYENPRLDLLCKYHFSTNIKLAASVYPHPGSSNIYVLDSNSRKLLNGVAEACRNTNDCTNNSTLDYDADFSWWAPNQVWMKRDVSKNPVEIQKDILSNINHNALSTIEKYFYNIKLSEGSKPAALKFTLLDGDVSLDTMYYAKVNVRLDYSGFNFDDAFITSNPDNALTESEANKVKINETSPPAYDYKQSPVKSCHTFYIPISWYPSNEVKNNKELEWANYINGSTGDASITFTPYGLMTYLINQASDPNNVYADSAGQIIIATKGWNIEDWNTLFASNMDIEFIAEKVPTSKYKLFNKLVTLDGLTINSGANITVTSNIADEDSMDWRVLDDSRVFVKSNSSSVFEIPENVNLLRNWVKSIDKITLNNFRISNESYTMTSDTSITIPKTENSSIFAGAELRGSFFYDIFFAENQKRVKEDNFNPDIERLKWLPFESVDDTVFTASLRKPSSSLVFESNDLTYDIINFKGKNSFKSINSNTSLFLDYKKTGKVTKNNNEIDVTKTEKPNVNKLYIIDDNNSIFDFTTDFIFDEEIGKNKNFIGKKFEHIVKAYTIYDPITNKVVLGGYYFVGVGVYGFDIGLGIARYNVETGKMDKSFLAGFGDYDTKNIKLGTWYTLKTIVGSEYIRVTFNEKDDPERLVINYFTNPISQTDSNRYLDGDFEELVYLVTGLSKMDITYPSTLGGKTNASFVAENFNEDLVKNFRATGTMTGMLFNNELTYVGNAKYTSTIQGEVVFGDTTQSKDLTDILEEISRVYGENGEVRSVKKTNNGNILVLIGNSLFFRTVGGPVAKYNAVVDKIIVIEDKVIIKTVEDEVANMLVCNENLTSYNSVYVRDLTFNNDHIYRYLEHTSRKIKNVWEGENRIHVEFGEHYPEFVTVWDTTQPGSSASNQITLPLIGTYIDSYAGEPLAPQTESVPALVSGKYSFTVDWGDGTSERITEWNSSAKTHTYAYPGVYIVTITGLIDGWRFNNGGDRRKLIDILQWVPWKSGNASGVFYGCNNLILTAEDQPNLSEITNGTSFFRSCSKMIGNGLRNWTTTGNINDFRFFFEGCSIFNADISNWDTTKMGSTAFMFRSCGKFNQPIGKWNTPKIWNPFNMFYGCSDFNQNLNGWDTSLLKVCAYCFGNAVKFNNGYPPGVKAPFTWNMSQIGTNPSVGMQGMFRMLGTSNYAFNADMTGWDVSKARSFQGTFEGCVALKHDFSAWQIPNVTHMGDFLNGVDINDPNSSANQDNYDATLISFAAQGLTPAGIQSNVPLKSASKYSAAAASARSYLTGTKGWTIVDGGLAP